MFKFLYKLVLFLIVAIVFSCGNEAFRKFHLDIIERGDSNCRKHLQSKFKSIFGYIQYKGSIMLLKHSNYWSEIDENEINKKHKIPKKYVHQYVLRRNNWLNYEFDLLSNDKCKCDIDLSYYSNICEKLTIYEELMVDEVRRDYIEEIGRLEFNNNYKLIIFGNEDNAENIAILENLQSVSEIALDWKFKKYGFLITSIDRREEPLIYFNKAVLIDINNRKIIGNIEPIL